MTGRRGIAAALAGALTLVAAAPAAASVLDRFSFLHVAPAATPQGLPRIADDNNRTVLLRGVAVNGLEDYYSNSSTPTAAAYPIAPAFYSNSCPTRNSTVESFPVCAQDATQLASFGYDVVRLGVSWSQLEPTPGNVDSTYVDRIAQVVSWLKAAGIYTIIDMHQDAWSKYLYTPQGTSCPPPFSPVTGSHESDGAPDWASVHVTPVCQIAAREVDPAVQEDFERLWADAPGPDGTGLQEHFANAVAQLAARFKDEPAVAGYDLFNEPSPGYEPAVAMDTTRLLPFYAKVLATIRRAVPSFQQLVLLEPDVTRDVTDGRYGFARWSTFSSYANAVWAPHIYTHVFTPDAEAGAPALAPAFPVTAGYRAAVQDARALGVPFFNGEFGTDISQDNTTLRAHYDNLDSLSAGGSLWVWKADGWSVMGPSGPFPSRVKFTDRAYPIYTAGTLQSSSYDPDTGAFDVRGQSSAVTTGDDARATVVYIPATTDPSRVRVAGATASQAPLPDGGTLIHVYPAGGAYRVYAS